MILGSARSAPPFWGGLPARTGDKVLKYLQAQVAAFNGGEGVVALSMEVLDPIAFPSAMTLTTNGGNPT